MYLIWIYWQVYPQDKRAYSQANIAYFSANITTKNGLILILKTIRGESLKIYTPEKY